MSTTFTNGSRKWSQKEYQSQICANQNQEIKSRNITAKSCNNNNNFMKTNVHSKPNYKAVLTKNEIVSLPKKKKPIARRKPTRPPIPHYRVRRYLQNMDSITNPNIPTLKSISQSTPQSIPQSIPQNIESTTNEQKCEQDESDKKEPKVLDILEEIINYNNDLDELPPLDRCISNPLMRQYSNLSVLSDLEGAHFVPYGRGHYDIANSPQNRNQNMNQDQNIKPNNNQKQNENNHKNENKNESIYVASKCVDQQTKTSSLSSDHTPIASVTSMSNCVPIHIDSTNINNSVNNSPIPNHIPSAITPRKYQPPHKRNQARDRVTQENIENIEKDHIYSQINAAPKKHIPKDIEPIEKDNIYSPIPPVAVPVDANINATNNPPIPNPMPAPITPQKYHQIQLQQKQNQAQNRVSNIDNSNIHSQTNAETKNEVAPDADIESTEQDNIILIQETSTKSHVQQKLQNKKPVKKGVYQMCVKEELIFRFKSNNTKKSKMNLDIEHNCTNALIQSENNPKVKLNEMNNNNNNNNVSPTVHVNQSQTLQNNNNNSNANINSTTYTNIYNSNSVKSTNLLNKNQENIQIITNSPRARVSETSHSTLAYKSKSNEPGHFVDDYFKKKAIQQQQIYYNNILLKQTEQMQSFSSIPMVSQPMNTKMAPISTPVYNNNMINKRKIPINSSVRNNAIKPVYNNIMYNINMQQQRNNYSNNKTTPIVYDYLGNGLNKMKTNNQNMMIPNINGLERSPSYQQLMNAQQRQQLQQVPLMKKPPPTIMHRPPPIRNMNRDNCQICAPPNRNSGYRNNRPPPRPQRRKKRNSGAPNKWQICWEFNSKKGCKWGKSCYWKHAYVKR